MHLPAAPPLYTFQQSLPYIPFSSPLPYLHLSAAPFPTSFSSPLQCTFQQPLPYTYFSSPSTMHLSAVPSPTYTFQQLPSLHHSAVLPHLSAVPSPMPSSSIPCYCSVPTCITNHWQKQSHHRASQLGKVMGNMSMHCHFMPIGYKKERNQSDVRLTIQIYKVETCTSFMTILPYWLTLLSNLICQSW